MHGAVWERQRSGTWGWCLNRCVGSVEQQLAACLHAHKSLRDAQHHAGRCAPVDRADVRCLAEPCGRCVARICASGTLFRATVDEGEHGHTRGSHSQACYGLSTERSPSGETHLWWREQRRGDGGGALFALRSLAEDLRRWSGLAPASEQRTRRPTELMYTPCETLSPPADFARVLTRSREVEVSKAIHSAIDCPDLMLRSGHRSGCVIGR